MRRNRIRSREFTDEEVRDILADAMAEVRADPALIFAFKRTGVYLCPENEPKLPKAKIVAWVAAVDLYFELLAAGVQ
jgi:hypothetical protein